MRRILTLMILATALAAPAAAKQTTRTPVAATPQPPTTTMKVDPRIDTSDVNISVVVNITDKSTTGPQNKTVSLIIANRDSGRVRSSGTTSLGNGNSRSSELNVDANTTLLKSGLISTYLTVNYQPEWTDEATKMTAVTQSVKLFLKDGVPMVIAQAADPTKGTRSVSIEVTAKVIR